MIDSSGPQLDQRWAWISFVHKLMTEMRYTEDQVYDMNFINACNWLSYFKEKEDFLMALEDSKNGTQRI